MAFDPTGALCAETDPDLFFPEGTNPQKQAKEAKQVCAICPLKAPCLEEALYSNEYMGIWGGTTASERKALRKALGIAPQYKQNLTYFVGK